MRDFTGRTILLVEDDAKVRALNARGLRSRGFTVIEAANGIEAMGALERAKVDLIVSDKAMPGPTKRPILFISGYGFDKTLPPRATFLHRPFTLGQLVRAVKSAMARR